MKEISLTRGKVALVDDEDFEFLSQWKWHCMNVGYAGTDVGGRKNKKKILMHRFLINTPSGLYTDHINGNKLDNRRSNLRSVTNSINLLTRHRLSKKNTSGHNGIEWYKNRWVARIKINYINIYLGRYSDINDAIKARKEAEEKYVQI